MKHIFFRKDIDIHKIFLHGRSLGGAVATYSCSEINMYTPAGLILENTFTSIPDMVDVVFSKLSWMKGPLVRNFFASVDRINKVKIPTLFIFAMKD